MNADQARLARERLMESRERIVPQRRPGLTFEDQARVITSGDVLRIAIAGEPELPTTYEVRTDGTVRVPLLGSFKVVGQTSQQVKTAIGRKLSDLGAGSASSVTVQLARAARIR